jgi:ketosteroid isomerase-like protein
MFHRQTQQIVCLLFSIIVITSCAKFSQLPARELASATEVKRIASAFDTITKANAEAWNAYDFDAMKALYTDDIVFTEATFGDHIVGIDEVMAMARGMSVSVPDMRRRITNHYIGLEDSLCIYDYWGFLGSTQDNLFLYIFQFKTRSNRISNWTLFEGLETAEKFRLASNDRLAEAKSLLANYQSAWSSGDPMIVAGLYSGDAVRTDTLFREKQEGHDAITSFAKSFFAWYPGVEWNLQQSFGEWQGESPTIGGTYSVIVNDSANQPCEVHIAVLLQAPKGKITHESLYYEPDPLIKCGWAK